ncbi:MAG: glycosyltransferase [Oscillospiraceae bacterium]|nr:glycosyltransferase [Oscillospiraceae bacterium]
MGKLISVIILSYNNADNINRAIDSVLTQDYDAVELIVSDDGSANFDVDKIRLHIEKRKRENLLCYQVLHNEKNSGTVQNLRNALKFLTGQYHMIIGGDDWLADKNVLSDFSNAYMQYPDEPMAICANAYMCDYNGEIIDTMMNRDMVLTLAAGDDTLLLNRLRYQCILLTVATCYRREFWEVVGMPDEEYTYLEDWPTFVKMAKRGIVPAFLPRIVTYHQRGGIANGAERVNVEQVRQLFADRQMLFGKETIPYLESMTAKDKSAYHNRQKYEAYALYERTVFNQMPVKKKILACLNNKTARSIAYRTRKQWLLPGLKILGDKLKALILVIFILFTMYFTMELFHPFGIYTHTVSTIIWILLVALMIVGIIKLLAKTLCVLLDKSNR